MVNTKELKAQMIRKGYTQKTLAAAIKMGEKTLNRKINNITPFGLDEAQKITDCLELENPTAIFFANDVTC